MRFPPSIDAIKLFAGGIIVLTACLIMMPAIISYVSSLGRIALIVLIALGTASAIGLFYVKIKTGLRNFERNNTTSSPTNKEP